MKTQLPEKISTVEEAKKFLKELRDNDEVYHPEDSAHDIVWDCASPTDEECDQLDSLMRDIYNLKGNENYPHDMIFEPCEYLIMLDKEFIVKDLSGRGYTTRMNSIDIVEKLLPDMEESAEDNMLLPKIVLSAVYSEMAWQYEPTTKTGKKAVKNLRIFI